MMRQENVLWKSASYLITRSPARRTGLRSQRHRMPSVTTLISSPCERMHKLCTSTIPHPTHLHSEPFLFSPLRHISAARPEAD